MFLQIRDMVKETLAYKKKIKTLELKNSQARIDKTKGSKNKIQLVLFEFHMNKIMPPKGRVLAFMMKFSMEKNFHVEFVKCIEFNSAMVSWYLENV